VSRSIFYFIVYSLAGITPAPVQGLYFTTGCELHGHSIAEDEAQILCHVFLAVRRFGSSDAVTVFKSITLQRIHPPRFFESTDEPHLIPTNLLDFIAWLGYVAIDLDLDIAI
jgi:hypothetical protein